MGSKNRYLISIILLVSFVQSVAQTTFRTIDSLTLAYYLKGDWNMLTSTGKSSIRAGIDYKHLRQRIGYACFVKNDFVQAKVNFQKAESFDKYDPFTLEYLYYSQLNTGRPEFTGFIQNRMSAGLLNNLELRRSIPVSSIDGEVSFKETSAYQRSGASFYRFGLGTRASPKLNFYQAFSFYTQYFGNSDSSLRVKQPDYYISVSLNIAPKIVIRSAWHYIHTINGGNVLPGNLILVGTGIDLNRLNFEASTSSFRSDYLRNWQAGLNAVYSFFGKSQFYLMTSVSFIDNNSRDNLVLGGGTGMRLGADTWIELNAVGGDMNGYNDFNGLYVYNTLDTLESRIGFTLRKYSGAHLSFWINLSTERYEYYYSNELHFRQISFLGGLKWKI